MNLRTVRGVTPEVLAGLSDSELITLADAVSGVTGEEFVTKGEREDAAERTLAQELEDDYLGDLYPAAEAELETLPETAVETEEVARALLGIGERMNARDVTRTREILSAGVIALAALSRGTLRERFPEGTPRTSPSFSARDVSSLERIGGQQLWWIGDLWGEHLSRRIALTVERAAEGIGLGRVQVGEILRGVVQNGTGAQVPGTWNGSVGGYFQMLAGTVRARSSATGAIFTMRDAEFLNYRISAVMDERTSEVCLRMDNRTFRVRDAERQIERAEAAENPEEFKGVAGWVSAERVSEIAGTGTAAEQSSNLSDAGLALPPYHGGCRTVVIEEGRA